MKHKKKSESPEANRITGIVQWVKSQDIFLLFVIPSLLGMVVFLFVPLIDVFRRSFCQGVSNHFWGLKNYAIIFHNKSFILAVVNTLKFEVICLPLLLFVSLLVAVGVHNTKNSFVKYALLVPMAIPANSVAVIWKVLFEKHGIINEILTDIFHIKAINFLDSENAFLILVLTYLWKNIGYSMLIWMVGLSAIPNNIYEAASIDGAGSFVKFFKITLPNLKGSLYALSVLSFASSFRVFREAYLISGNYPNESIYLMQHLFNNWFQKLDIGKLAAASSVIAVFLFVVLACLKKLIFRERNSGRYKKSKGDEELYVENNR